MPERVLIEPCEHGKFGSCDVPVRVSYSVQWLCPGGQRVEPDYEAAAAMYGRIEWDGDDPPWEVDGSVLEAHRKYARRIVDAALGYDPDARPGDTAEQESHTEETT